MLSLIRSAALCTLTVTKAVQANPADAIALFDALCIGTGGNITLIEKMAIAAGGKLIPPQVMYADQAIAQYGGKGFALKRNGKTYSVAATPNRACSVMAQDVHATEVQRLLVENYPLSKPERDSSGTQNVTLWHIVAPSRLEGGVVVLNAAKSGFGVDNAISLGYIPANATK